MQNSVQEKYDQLIKANVQRRLRTSGQQMLEIVNLLNPVKKIQNFFGLEEQICDAVCKAMVDLTTSFYLIREGRGEWQIHLLLSKIDK